MTDTSYRVTEGDFRVSPHMSVYYRDYQPKSRDSKTPIVYLPGLMRTARDFDRIVPRFAGERRVVTIDTRGRGRGGRSDDPTDYAFDSMIEDVWMLTAELGIEKMVIVGLALGAFMAWRMAARHPERVAAIAVNDTGTEPYNPAGKKMVALADQGQVGFEEAVCKLREPNQKNFLDFGDDDWRTYTRQVYAEVSPGKWKRDFHPAILDAWSRVKEEMPSMWHEYERVPDIPILVLRGESSEYLAQELADRMVKNRTRARCVNVQGRGHPLLLDEPAALAAIRALLSEADSHR